MASIQANPPSDNPAATTTASLPPEVITCLQNARFLHLATSSSNIPHVSLMNYTYLPPSSSPYSAAPLIIMTTHPSSTKTTNLLSNPRVSLLVHDWVSHRPPTLTNPSSDTPNASQSPGPGALTLLLQNLNSASLSRISATINGDAEILAQGSEQEAWCRKRHIENNTFGPSAERSAQSALNLFSSSPTGEEGWSAREEGEGDGGKKHWVEGEGHRVVVVRIRDGRISDWKGRVSDWSLERPVVNGV